MDRRCLHPSLQVSVVSELSTCADNPLDGIGNCGLYRNFRFALNPAPPVVLYENNENKMYLTNEYRYLR
jgi:hypothetical protein